MNRRVLSWILVGVGATLLGSLWLLQGTGLLHVRPILCLADCKPLEGRSVGWMIAGAVAMLGGLRAIAAGFRRRGRRT